MEKVKNMRLQIIRTENKVANNTTVGGRFNSKSVIQGQRTRAGMADRSNPADSLHYLLGITRVTSPHN